MRLALAMALAAVLVPVSTASVHAVRATSACSPVETRALIKRFVTAFNAGNRPALNTIWASKVWFKWFSVTAEPGSRTPGDAARRDLLLPYFASRHAAHERLTVTAIKLNGITAGAYRNFEFQLSRRADDLPDGPAAYVGKGASTCSTGRLFVWVMGPKR
jgi:hypothetical protein